MLKKKFSSLVILLPFTLFGCMSDNSIQDSNIADTNAANASNNPASATDSVVTSIDSSMFPKISVALNNNPTDGEILISPFTQGAQTSGNLMILDKSGNIIKAKKTQGESLNFKKWNIADKVRYSYAEHEAEYQISSTSSNVPGSDVLLDENLNEIKRVKLLPYNDRITTFPTDAHDFILIDDNHYISMSYYPKTVNNIPSQLNPDQSTTVIEAVIQEVNNDQVVWEWDSTKYPELYTSSVEGNDFKNKDAQNDYVHLNSMFIDPNDQNLICSFRNLSQILKIDRKTGNIIWRLGGANSDFPLTDEQKFHFQHNVTLVDDNKTLLLFDNGGSVVRPYTRISEFQLDEVNKKVTSFKTTNAPGNIFSQYMGSVQKRGDTYFIGWGTVPRVSELNYKTGELTFDMNLGMNTYRAFKY